METLFRSHTALLLKHARRFLRSSGGTVPVEDVAREAELILAEVGRQTGLRADQVVSPEALIRVVIRHAAGRVKRRRTLIDQIAAGDDLVEVSRDLAAVDGDVPTVVGAPTSEQAAAFELLSALKRALPPHDALIAALLFDDDFPAEDVSRLLSRPLSEIEVARERILITAKEQGIEGDPDARAPAGTKGDTEKMRELKLKRLAADAVGASPAEGHVEEALLRLLRDGDASDDIGDAMAHVAACAQCRASLTEGEVQRRSVVVLAIEASSDAVKDIEKAASDARAQLAPRGQGRWTAVVETSRAASFKDELDREDAGSLVTRVAMTAPVDVPLQAQSTSPRRAMGSVIDITVDMGTSAAEVEAWARVSRERKRRVEPPHPGWALLAVVTVAGAAFVAYLLATR